MFADSLSLNLLLFLAAQIAVWGYLRTGLLGHGVTLLLGTWALGDVALMARFAYGHTGWVYLASLSAMQALALLGVGRLLYGRVRRHRPVVREARDGEFRSATLAEFRGEDEEAQRIYGRLCRRDPWDGAARVALARVHRRLGRDRLARRLLHAAGRVDPHGLGDLVTVELEAMSDGVRLNARRSEERPPASGAKSG